MMFLDISTDVLAVKCFKDYIFIGIGCTLYVVSQINFKVKVKISALHPDNIHGIIIKPNNKLICYGGKSLCIFQLSMTDDSISIQKSDDIHKFDDWIISINRLGAFNDPTVKILFAHNNVYNYDLCKKTYSNYICKETCLLYAGSIFELDYENAIIFSGAVFQEILIWKVNYSSDSKFSEVLHRLKGHKGVIFSVFYNSENNFICSTSDDRTVRLWKVFDENILDQKSIIWENAKIFLQTTMYGHLARVWKAIVLKNIIASIGEDSRICFWSFGGELLHKIQGHQGAPIWCIDISENDIIFTGGADGSVNSWPFASIKSSIKKYTLLKDNRDIVPKYVTFDNSNILIYSNMKNSCKILQFLKNEYEPTNTYNLPAYSSTYCIMQLSPNKHYLALASIKGDITLFTKIENVWQQIVTHKVTDSKILSVQWLNNDISLICAEEGNLTAVQFFENRFTILSQHILPPSRERWITSACMEDCILICGDRVGSIFVYNLKNDSEHPIQSLKKIHGKLGVQSCSIINSTVVTTGRDGALRFYKFCDNDDKNSTIEFLYSRNMPMDWVSRLLVYQNDYYVLGFKEEDFVIYSVRLKRILVKFPCGGGHRSWDCEINDDLINFVYIQKQQVYAVTIPVHALFISPLMPGFHIKEIYCIKALPISSENHHILISGGEDCTLRLNYINALAPESELRLNSINSFDGHLSSIKCISIFTIMKSNNFSKHLIFSGGGRAQLKVWEVTVQINENTLLDKDISFKDLLSYMLHGPDKERNKLWIGKELMYNVDPETRYMYMSSLRNPYNKDNIFIFIACSDGYLRTLSYFVKSNEIKLIDTLAYRNRCILKIHSFMHQEEIVLLTMATDGLLNFWNVSVVNDIISIKSIIIEESDNLNLHQSGINSFDIKSLINNEYILATGGDDNLLNLLVFKFILNKNKILSVQIVCLWKSVSAHYAQITGVKLLSDNKLLTVGADQKLVIHNYSFNNLKICSVLLEEKTLCISDIQGIEICENQKNETDLFCVYGKGFQLLRN